MEYPLGLAQLLLLEERRHQHSINIVSIGSTAVERQIKDFNLALQFFQSLFSDLPDSV